MTKPKNGSTQMLVAYRETLQRRSDELTKEIDAALTSAEAEPVEYRATRLYERSHQLIGERIGVLYAIGELDEALRRAVSRRSVVQ